MTLGLAPRIIVGDLDSVPQNVLDSLEEQGVIFQIYPAEKDKSDLELALECAIDRKPREIVMVGVLGERVDHSLSNILLLIRCRQARIPAKIIGEKEEIFLLEGNVDLQGRPGSLISLLPLTSEVKGITLDGLKYPLRGEDLLWGSSRGLSNEFTTGLARIGISSGLLLVVIHRSVAS